MLDSAQVPELHAQVATRVVDGQAIIVLADSGEVTVLNETGTHIWEWIDGKHSVAEIAACLSTRYALPLTTALSDTEEFLQRLVDVKALILRDEAA